MLASVGYLLVVRPLGAKAERVSSLPIQIYRIATDRRLRRNHALEHATINVLTERYGQPHINGVAVQAGFVLRGLVNPQRILAAAGEGLTRLRSGERELAYHPRCGTSLGTADLLAWLVLVALLVMTGRISWLGLGGGLILAVFGGPILGRWVQRRLTTSVDVSMATIAGMTVHARPAPRGTTVQAADGEFWGEVIIVVQHRDERHGR